MFQPEKYEVVNRFDTKCSRKPYPWMNIYKRRIFTLCERVENEAKCKCKLGQKNGLEARPKACGSQRILICHEWLP